MSACRCTDTEVCFPCRDREAHRDKCDECPSEDGCSPCCAYVAPEYLAERGRGPYAPPPAEAPDVEPATDEQIARDEARAKDGAVTGAHRTLALIARLRQTEERFETAVRWAERLLRTVDEKKDERDEARAEAARLREQVDDWQEIAEERRRSLARAEETFGTQAARLREQVAAMQAEVARRPPARFSGGAFW